MKEVQIRLPSTQKVQEFVGVLAPLNGDFELISDRIILDARSIMGIFAFDLTQPLRLKVYNDSAENMAAIAPYRIDMEETDHEQ